MAKREFAKSTAGNTVVLYDVQPDMYAVLEGWGFVLQDTKAVPYDYPKITIQHETYTLPEGWTVTGHQLDEYRQILDSDHNQRLSVHRRPGRIHDQWHLFKTETYDRFRLEDKRDAARQANGCLLKDRKTGKEAIICKPTDAVQISRLVHSSLLDRALCEHFDISFNPELTINKCTLAALWDLEIDLTDELTQAIKRRILALIDERERKPPTAAPVTTEPQ